MFQVGILLADLPNQSEPRACQAQYPLVVGPQYKYMGTDLEGKEGNAFDWMPRK